jgi:hypothetical protein
MSAIDDVISKVRKLYTLAEANTSEHEAAVAIAAAEKLLQQYRLSRAEIDASSDSNVEIPTEDGEPVETYASRIPVWQKVLVGTLAKHYGCVVYHHVRSPNEKVIKIVGCPSDVRLFRLQYDRVKSQIDRLTFKNGLGKGRSYCDSYRKGLVVVVHERLAEMRTFVRQEATSTALVKLDEREALAAQRLMDTHTNVRTTRTPMRVYENGYQAGRADGHQIGLGEELEPPVRGLPRPNTPN